MVQNFMFKYVFGNIKDIKLLFVIFTLCTCTFFVVVALILTSMPFNIQITKVLFQEYPKLQNLRGGWLLQKASGKFMKPNAFSCLILLPVLLLFFMCMFKRGQWTKENYFSAPRFPGLHSKNIESLL